MKLIFGALFLLTTSFTTPQRTKLTIGQASDSKQAIFDVEAIKKQLSDIYERDQKTRTGKDSTDFMSYIDSCNLIQVEEIITKYGWLGKSVIGNKANVALFLIIQHSELSVQEKYLPLLEESVSKGESRATDMALLKDRVLMRQGKKQLYGSQVVYSKTGEQIFYQIEDEKNVNKRRKAVGLEPIEEYAKFFGIEYKAPIE